jgi:hypothetical protein
MLGAAPSELVSFYYTPRPDGRVYLRVPSMYGDLEVKVLSQPDGGEG